MARGRVSTAMIRRLDGHGETVRPDKLVVEEPMEIRLDDHRVATTMRTPGHDYELAVGFCLTEGLLAGAPVRTVRYCATGPASDTAFNVVTVSTDGLAPVPEPRLQTSTSSCGLCGSASIGDLCKRLAPLPRPLPAVDVDALARAAAATRARQELFEQTGSIHAAAVFDPASGDVSVIREDIGRHNAVDKIIGRLHLDGQLPATGLGLFVSGRASFEIVQKAWAGGFPLLVAVSGPSGLAVETAREAGMVLVGFLRGTAANIYAPQPGLGTAAAG
jgi:FdhD protein